MTHTERIARMTLAQQLKREGHTYRKIGEILGISYQRAYQLVRPPKAIYDMIKLRAHGCCELCRITVPHGHIHHKELQQEITWNDPVHLIYLCPSCHRRQHAKSIAWNDNTLADDMMASTPYTISFHLSLRAHTLLKALAEALDLSQTSVLEILIRERAATALREESYADPTGNPHPDHS